jgi:putative tricarboxylic transport membrane protein
MRNYQIIPTLFWIGLSLFVMVISYKMGLGEFHAPGPGLMPFLLGALLLITSFYLLGKSLLRKTERDETVSGEWDQANYRKIALVLASLFFFALLLETLGYLIVASLFFIFLFRSMGNRWRTVWMASALTVLVTFFGFTFFGVKFPLGILKF